MLSKNKSLIIKRQKVVEKKNENVKIKSIKTENSKKELRIGKDEV